MLIDANKDCARHCVIPIPASIYHHTNDLRIKSARDTAVLQSRDVVEYEQICPRVTSFDQASPSYRLSDTGCKLLQAFDIASIGNEPAVVTNKTAYNEAFRWSAIAIKLGRVGLAVLDQNSSYRFRVQAGNGTYFNNGFTIGLSTDRWDRYICHMRR